MLKASIYRPSKTAMQSGRGKDALWVLEYDPRSGKTPEPLMGWTSGSDTLQQVRIKFPTLEEAKNHAERNGMTYTITQPHERKIKPRNYGDNFKYVPPKDEGQK